MSKFFTTFSIALGFACLIVSLLSWSGAQSPDHMLWILALIVPGQLVLIYQWNLLRARRAPWGSRTSLGYGFISVSDFFSAARQIQLWKNFRLFVIASIAYMFLTLGIGLARIQPGLPEQRGDAYFVINDHPSFSKEISRDQFVALQSWQARVLCSIAFVFFAIHSVGFAYLEAQAQQVSSEMADRLEPE